jgi:toxin YoeB
MSVYKLDITKKAMSDLDYHVKSGDKSCSKKIKKLLVELEEHPTKGTGKPEQLKHDPLERWSRRINGKHRLVYRIFEDQKIVEIHQLKDHYEE